MSDMCQILKLKLLAASVNLEVGKERPTRLDFR